MKPDINFCQKVVRFDLEDKVEDFQKTYPFEMLNALFRNIVNVKKILVMVSFNVPILAHYLLENLCFLLMCSLKS